MGLMRKIGLAAMGYGAYKAWKNSNSGSSMRPMRPPMNRGGAL
ncbi:MAG TPA: hypothetical protein VFH78_15945 [Candidatus Thermoplasmatota archaeon]|nr:hypothetical protein [Candidatus Thermoplasmatota archaeon]